MSGAMKVATKAKVSHRTCYISHRVIEMQYRVFTHSAEIGYMLHVIDIADHVSMIIHCVTGK